VASRLVDNRSSKHRLKKPKGMPALLWLPYGKCDFACVYFKEHAREKCQRTALGLAHSYHLCIFCFEF
jgi:hypothetical protein